MRNIFLALVLANLAFAAWHNWFVPSDELVRPASNVPTITLASEAGADDAPAALETGADALVEPRADDVTVADGESPPGAATDSSGEASQSSDSDDVEGESLAAAELDAGEGNGAAELGAISAERHCVSVGPFRELSQATSAAAALRGGGYEPTQRAGEGDIWVGYWVYLERIPTQERANEILEELRENGVTDSYVIPDSDSGNLISLGVFTEIGRAGGRREEARRLGYEPVIVDRTRRGTVYWVDIMLEPTQSVDFDLLQSPGRILRLEQRSCDRAPA